MRARNLRYRIQSYAVTKIQWAWRRGRILRRWRTLASNVVAANENPLDRFSASKTTKKVPEIDFKALSSMNGKDQVVYEKRKSARGSAKPTSVTLPKLVEIMIKTLDTELMHTVIITLPNFAEPYTFMKLLLAYLRTLDHTCLEGMTLLLHTWMRLTPRDFDAPSLRGVLDELLLFVRKGFGRDRADSILSGMERKRELVRGLSPKQIRMSKVCRSYMDLEPLEAARQLTLASFSLIQDLDPRELNQLAWQSTDTLRAPIVRVIIDRCNKVSNWVATAVLLEDEEAGIAALEWWIATAHHCLLLNNFSDLMSIAVGLQHHCVSRLHSRWAKLTPPVMLEYQAIEKITAMEKNYKNMRSLMKKTTAPLIPFLGIALKDLVFIEENPTMMGDQISMDKMDMIYRVIQTVKNCASTTYPLMRVPAWQALLWPPSSFVEEQTLYNSSLKIEPRGAADSPKLRASVSDGGSLRMSGNACQTRRMTVEWLGLPTPSLSMSGRVLTI